MNIHKFWKKLTHPSILFDKIQIIVENVKYNQSVPEKNGAINEGDIRKIKNRASLHVDWNFRGLIAKLIILLIMQNINCDFMLYY